MRPPAKPSGSGLPQQYAGPLRKGSGRFRIGALLLTFSSPIENIRFVSLESNNRNKKFIYGYFWEQYLYIDKNDDIDIYIDKNIYEQNDIFFSILYGDTINDFLNKDFFHVFYYYLLVH